MSGRRPLSHVRCHGSMQSGVAENQQRTSTIENQTKPLLAQPEIRGSEHPSLPLNLVLPAIHRHTLQAFVYHVPGNYHYYSKIKRDANWARRCLLTITAFGVKGWVMIFTTTAVISYDAILHYNHQHQD